MLMTCHAIGEFHGDLESARSRSSYVLALSSQHTAEAGAPITDTIDDEFLNCLGKSARFLFPVLIDAYRIPSNPA